jgi:hypothetical protein
MSLVGVKWNGMVMIIRLQIGRHCEERSDVAIKKFRTHPDAERFGCKLIGSESSL